MPSFEHALTPDAPFMFAHTDRTVCEVWDPSAGKAWRIVSLGGGGFAFELEADQKTVLREPHSSLVDAVARANRWREESAS
jgi:hypothetical protein